MHEVQTAGLTHRFARDAVLRGVDIAVPSGSIYGFLGPNGAGKTTTLRLLLGLLRRQHGEILIFGTPFAANRLDILRRIGSSIETPSLYGHLSAVENLEVWRRIFQCPRARIAHVLAVVGLEDTGRKRTDQFSLGMRQRLALAIALLHEPRLLILDEPTNGLDPQGILDMRALLARLNREEGTTILVSSHILSEVERLVTHVGITHRGTLRFQGTLEELRLSEGQRASTSIDCADNVRALAIAAALGFAGRIQDGRAVLPALSRSDAGRLSMALADAGLPVFEFATTRRDLERIFLDLVSGD